MSDRWQEELEVQAHVSDRMQQELEAQDNESQVQTELEMQAQINDCQNSLPGTIFSLYFVTKNIHSLHQTHITCKIHQFYTFLKSDFDKYAVYSEYFWCIPALHPIHQIYTFISGVRVYVSAG